MFCLGGGERDVKLGVQNRKKMLDEQHHVGDLYEGMSLIFQKEIGGE